MIVSLLLLAAAVDKPKPPAIPDSMRADFFQAQADYLQSQTALKAAQDDMMAKQKAFSSQLEVLQKTCGDGYVPNLDASKKLVCVERPEAPATPHKQ